LASKSREAAHDTSELITQSIERVDEGTKRARDTASSLEQIVENVITVADVIEKIRDASIQQAEAISHVSIGINQISSVIQSNSATSEESAAASEELSSQSETLKEMISFFKTE
jgi:methyl-accepting chemotaxis protein